MAAWQLTKVLWKSDGNDYERFEVTQPLFHAGYYEDVADYLDVCGDQGLAVCPYSPLAGGFLTGKYERADPDDPKKVIAPDGSRADFDERFQQFYLSERGWHVLDAVREVADELDASPAQVALRWLMDYPDATVIPIVGARTADQLEENVGAAELDLSTDQWERITNARYTDEGRVWGH
jgi:aryl-alcohol dehydrogenase-like predicted oxidoreductase